MTTKNSSAKCKACGVSITDPKQKYRIWRYYKKNCYCPDCWQTLIAMPSFVSLDLVDVLRLLESRDAEQL
jgi:hypothetical protein